ncbi:transglycosylase domain-containing protein [uncultured Peptoniphilus sp.]|uniref:transglycosylase domain-containing protein n=1 Tax=uncultured Peptoniphilus sp. TaxID=254354 RepID=UPI002587E653|nr:transglycosylase domain-containing protein [uncultured Peptoniphilus sp.]MDU6783314.1 transglycosylase domain-containing protein [Peptoniphilus harei]
MKNFAHFKNNFKNLNKGQKIKIGLLILLLIFVLIISLFSALIISIISKTPATDLNNLSSSFNQSSYIYSKEGNLIEKIESLEYRTLIDIDDIPDNVKNAFVAIEDHRFYKHKGLDPIGIASSIAANIKSRSLLRGGSTITQQLVRSVYLTNQKTLGRKIQEAYLSLRVEDVLDKNEILEAYLNRINLGQGAYGIEAAAQTYFSKDAVDLNIAEAALLAGIPKSPTNYSPFKSVPEEYLKDDFKIIGSREIDGKDLYMVLNDDAFKRQRIVLMRMHELGYIDDKDYEKAKNYDIVSALNPRNFKNHTMSTYSTDYIKKEASKYLADFYKTSLEEGEHKLFTGGYKVYSTIDENIQKDLENKYENFKNFLLNRSSSGGSRMLNLNFDAGNNIIFGDEILYFHRNNILDENFNLVIPKSSYSISSHGDLKIKSLYFKDLGQKIDIIDAYVIDNNKILNTFEIGGLKIEEGAGELKNNYLIIDGSYLKDYPDFYKIENDKLIISNKYFDFNPNPLMQPQSAMIVVNNDTGFVEGIIGGLDVRTKNAKILNRATDSYRQPGSALTPLTVYLPALMEGKTLGDVYDDVPRTYDGLFWPHNYYDSFKGLMTIRLAMENSSNVIAADLLNEIGKDKALDVLKKFEIIKEDGNDYFINQKENKKKNDENLESLALGNMQVGLSLYDLSKMYQTISNEGVYKEETAILKIEDPSGNIIIDNSKKEKKLFDHKISHLLKDAFISNGTRGNASGTSIGNSETGAYLGQNKTNSDYFINAFNKSHTISLWIGADSPKISLSSDKSSAVELFNRMAKNLSKDEKFDEDPSYIVTRNISSKSGKLATKMSNYAGASYREKFISGTEPSEQDDLFKKYLICKDSNKLATQFCPSESVLYTVRFERKDKYDAKDHYGIYPDDYMTVPKEHCDFHTREWYNEFGEDEEDNSLNNNDKKTKKSSKHDKSKKSSDKIKTSKKKK